MSSAEDWIRAHHRASDPESSALAAAGDRRQRERDTNLLLLTLNEDRVDPDVGLTAPEAYIRAGLSRDTGSKYRRFYDLSKGDEPLSAPVLRPDGKAVRRVNPDNGKGHPGAYAITAAGREHAAQLIASGTTLVDHRAVIEPTEVSVPRSWLKGVAYFAATHDGQHIARDALRLIGIPWN